LYRIVLLDECRGHVVCSRPLPCQSIFLGLPCLLVPYTYPWSASFVYGMIHSLHMTKILHSPLLYPVCDLLRHGIDQPYHTPLYSCLCKLLLQFSSNKIFQIPVGLICFPVFVSKSKFQSCTSTHWVLYTFNFVVLLMSIDDHTFFNIWNTVLANPNSSVTITVHPIVGTDVTTQVNKIVSLRQLLSIYVYLKIVNLLPWPRYWISVFDTLIHMPKFLAVWAIQSTVTCKSDTFSERRAISSAKHRSGMTTPLITAPLWLLSRAIAMTASGTRT